MDLLAAHRVTRWTRGAAIALVLTGAMLPCRSALAAGETGFKQVVEVDFKGRAFDAKVLHFQGKKAPDLVKLESKGLRIAIPPGLRKPAPVGVAPRFRVQGDFDISGRFEVLKANKPSEGHGVGVQFWVETDTPTKEAASIGWTFLPGEGGTAFTTMHITGPPDQRKFQRESKPARNRAGTLRFVRRGTTLTMSCQDGPGTAERVLRQFEFPREDLALVRFAAHTGWSKEPVEIRLLSVTIAADGLPGYGGPETSPRGWLPWLLVVSVTVLVVAGGGLATARMAKGRNKRGVAP